MDDVDLEGEFGFEPAVASVAAHDPAPKTPGTRRRGHLRRRLTAAAVLSTALIGTGAAYAAVATSSGASDTTTSTEDIAAGKQLYEASCITCHGVNLQGVRGRGVTLLGVGASAVYFQVSTGRMPAVGQYAQEPRKEAQFNELQVEQLSAYVQSVGGGPQLPTGDLRDMANVADGGTLFRLNCASCHGTTFRGAPLSAGKYAPTLWQANDKQIYSAMQTGPENMPVFSDNQITPEQKREIIAYIQTLKASQDPGGNGIDRIGPVSEAVVIWVGGVGAIMIMILWIGAKTQ